ncbi:MAG: hypothetical protein R3288_13565 [Woeseiaceae bacterium]|nr:hypothetical protein [Woeseiaceae bacterium]
MRSAAATILGIAVTLLAPAASPADVLPDPTRPDTLRATHAAPVARYRINAIIVSDDRRIAIVNGRRAGVGDYVDGARITSIEPRAVVLDVGGESRTLQLRQGPTDGTR